MEGTNTRCDGVFDTWTTTSHPGLETGLRTRFRDSQPTINWASEPPNRTILSCAIIGLIAHLWATEITTKSRRRPRHRLSPRVPRLRLTPNPTVDAKSPAIVASRRNVQQIAEVDEFHGLTRVCGNLGGTDNHCYDRFLKEPDFVLR